MQATEKLAKGIPQIRNSRINVTKWQFRPGESTGFHIHEYDYIVVPLATGELTAINSDDSTTVTKLEVGKSYFRQKGVAHNIINSNPFDFAFVEIELL